ncbi:hypothetical protein CCACVL1_05103 [Corchorus capsularis]|uniref:Uncharacterized protein n=1 Tax=Corchorus capsularis TaxID=210143 RepID=A0A1R3JMR7_COCAP|nr:hypothetical protein CCACVL1_05103 [Corchorus capsularis]
MVNEFGDVELPNLNINANPSTGFNNLATPSYNLNHHNHHGNLNMNLNMDFAAATAREVAASLPSSLAWPSSILNPNLSMNSFLLKALQFRNNYQPRDVTAMDYSLLSLGSTQGNIHQPLFGTGLGSNLQSAAAASSSKVLDPMPSQQQQQQQEQPFNMDSMWS